MGLRNDVFLSMDPFLENKLIGNILKEYPQMSKIMERYFGGHCLERPGFKIQTLEMACILFGVDQKRLFQEFEKTQN
jgi:hypothetical protein